MKWLIKVLAVIAVVAWSTNAHAMSFSVSVTTDTGAPAEGVDVTVSRFGDAPRDVLIALDNSLLRAIAHRHDRHRSICQERHDCGRRHQQCEACRDFVHVQ